MMAKTATPAQAPGADLSDYTLGELKGLLFEVGQAIKDRQRRDVDDARERIMTIARGAGLPAEKLLDGAAILPRYRNPDDASQTWSGRGRQPTWVTEALAAGKTLDQLKF
jgi:DNA-binding protein H-NS